ncbi:MAG: cytochrome c biogenesis protein CcdA [Thermoleophilia bacterium]
MLFLIVAAFVAGVVTALSPCVLPALPVVLAGSAGGGARRVAGIAVGFVASFVVFTLVLTAALRNAGLGPTALRNIAIAALIAFGATLAVPALGSRFVAAMGPLARLGDRIPAGGSGLAGGLLVGVALGLVWTPCAGPVFAAIAAIAATGDAGPRSFVALTAYAVGAIVPLCLVAVGGRRVLSRLRGRAGAATRPALGLVMIGAGVVLALGLDARLTAELVEDVPAYTRTLQALERTPAVRRRLDGLRPPTLRSGLPPFIDAARAATGLGLPDAGPAPRLRGIGAGFNSGGAPIDLGGLRGRVVLVDFWTYSCINCLRTIPRLEALYRRYGPDGFTVVGVHTPEFLFESEPGNVGRAVHDLGITYPVVLDPRYETWEAFGVAAWPTTFLIDREGHVRDMHIGEGDEARTEDQIRRLLEIPASAPRAAEVDEQAPPAPHGDLTPETYVGHLRLTRLARPERVAPDQSSRYRAPALLARDEVAFDGSWTVGREAARADRSAALELSFRARRVFLVLDGAGADRPRRGRVTLDGRAPGAGEAGSDVGAGGRLRVAGPRLYRLIDLPRTGTGRLRVELPPGTLAYSFTFG